MTWMMTGGNPMSENLHVCIYIYIYVSFINVIYIYIHILFYYLSYIYIHIMHVMQVQI